MRALDLTGESRMRGRLQAETHWRGDFVGKTPRRGQPLIWTAKEKVEGSQMKKRKMHIAGVKVGNV